MRPWSLIPVFIVASIAWLAFGSIMHDRTMHQKARLTGKVSDLWGTAHVQRAPGFERQWTTTKMVDRIQTRRDGSPLLGPNGVPLTITEEDTTTHREVLPPTSTDLAVDLALDLRRKGLLWFPLYDNRVAGEWTYRHTLPDQTITVVWSFPVENAVYDDFRFVVNGTDVSDRISTANGAVRYAVSMATGDELRLEVGYASRGMTSWRYAPTDRVARIPNFNLRMTTDFNTIDFPDYTLSPSEKRQMENGWELDWTFTQIVTGHGMGMIMPERIQPGPLVAKLSFSAPISLGLFMVWLTAIGVVSGTRIHWINHLFIAASFFSFHLLFGYTADHIPTEWAFAVSAVVSMALVGSYLRTVVGVRFALVEAGIAQFLYLVAFALAHFLEGYTGLCVTVLGIATLGAIMHLTAGIDWDAARADDPRSLPGSHQAQ